MGEARSAAGPDPLGVLIAASDSGWGRRRPVSFTRTGQPRRAEHRTAIGRCRPGRTAMRLPRCVAAFRSKKTLDPLDFIPPWCIRMRCSCRVPFNGPVSLRERLAGFLFARHVMHVGGASPPRAVMTGTARAGQGVHREVESEGSRRPNLGLDEQKSDTRPTVWGNPAMDGEARWSFGHASGRSGEARGKEASLNLGGLAACPPLADYRRGNTVGGTARSQQRPW